jgi:hypothetical protein
MRGGLARRRMFFPRSNDARRHATG